MNDDREFHLAAIGIAAVLVFCVAWLLSDIAFSLRILAGR